MNWICLTVRTTTEGAEAVTALFMDLGIMGAMIEDRSDIQINQRPEGQWDIIDENIALNMDEDVKVSAYIAQDERAMDTVRLVGDRLNALKAMDLGFDAGKLTLETGSLDEEDWAESWKKSYTPVRLGEHYVIKPTWTEYAPQEGDRIIEMDPGMAFGTGTHETTALCVALIEQYVKPGDDIIDVGTGTGILAMAGVMAGAKDALAIDLDPVAVRVAAENIERNGMKDVIRAKEGDLLAAVDEVADVVIANIIADVIVFLAEPVIKHIRPDGWFICSGIARERKEEVLDRLNELGYRELDIRDKGEWTAIAARRP